MLLSLSTVTREATASAARLTESSILHGGTLRDNYGMEIVILVSLLSLYCDFTDAECPVISPARLVVKYGDPASSNCSSDTPVEMGWEATQGGMGLTDKKVKFLNWRVDSVTTWNNNPKCYTEGGQCLKQLDITVYKLPDSVSMTGPSGPMVEGKVYKFKCLIQNVAPINSLNVYFYKTSTIGKKTKTLLYAADVARQTTKEPISVEYPLLWSPSRGDDGAQLWCSALLGLGPQPPPEMESEPFNLSVPCESICFCDSTGDVCSLWCLLSVGCLLSVVGKTERLDRVGERAEVGRAIGESD